MTALSDTETAVWFLRQHGELLLDLLRQRPDDEQARAAAFVLQGWRAATMTRLDILRELVKASGGSWDAIRAQKALPGRPFTKERAWQMLNQLTVEGLLVRLERKHVWVYPEKT